MNTFVKIKLIERYAKVVYYSVSIDDEQLTLFDKFIAKHETTNRKKLNHILEWISEIGENIGARKELFRNEAVIADTAGLPPVGMEREPAYTESGKKKPNNLRLYCLQANESVVFLFDGDIKTENNALDCPNVKPHLNLANQITKAIDRAIIERDIQWNNNMNDIDFDPDLIIYL